MSTDRGTIHVPPPHPASLESDALLEQCSVSRGRSQGPGGQHRNKVETRVTLVHVSTGVEAHAGERRSQEQNRKVAVFRLRLALATRVRCPVPAGEIRTALWRSRVGSSGRVSCNPEHNDFPTMLALAMDVLAGARWDPTTAGLRLGCTSSQILKLLRAHPAAFSVVNAEREAAGLRILH